MKRVNFNIHRFREVDPESIRRASKEAPDFEAGEGSKRKQLKNWEEIMKKLQLSKPLTSYELSIAIANIEKLGGVEYQGLKDVFHHTAKEQHIKKITDLISENLAPIELIKFALEMEDPMWPFSKYLPKGMIDHKKSFLTHGDLEAIVSDIQTQYSSLKELLEKMKPIAIKEPTRGQRLVLELLQSVSGIGRWIDSDGYWIKEFIDTCLYKPKLKLSILEAFVRSYITDNGEAWIKKLLSSDNVLSKICEEVKKERLVEPDTDLEKHAPSIFRVLREKENLRSVISKLAEVSLERGKYWEDKIMQSDRVITRQFQGGKVGLAVTFGDYVIVEFGPVGNAAIVYSKEVFEKEIKSSSEWRDISKSKVVPGFTREDGTIHHHTGWEFAFNSLIQRIKLNQRE